MLAAALGEGRTGIPLCTYAGSYTYVRYPPSQPIPPTENSSGGILMRIKKK